MTSKAVRHIELIEKSVREWVQDKTIFVKHVAGKLNGPEDIFTKEMRDGAHFCRLRDSFICQLSNFLNTSLLATHQARQRSQHSVAPSAAWIDLASGASSYFSAINANSFCRSVTAISHLSSAGCQLLRGIYGFIPSGLIWCRRTATFIDFVLGRSLRLVFVLRPVIPPKITLLGIQTVLFFHHGDPLWTLGWGVSSLSVVLERRLS